MALSVVEGLFMVYYVYLLEMKDKRIYTGYTDNLLRREKEHKNGKGAKVTATYGTEKILHVEKHSSRAKALRREKQIKRWTRAKKLALISGNIKELKNLSRCQNRN